jgi:hypothetical protein
MALSPTTLQKVLAIMNYKEIYSLRQRRFELFCLPQIRPAPPRNFVHLCCGSGCALSVIQHSACHLFHQIHTPSPRIYLLLSIAPNIFYCILSRRRVPLTCEDSNTFSVYTNRRPLLPDNYPSQGQYRTSFFIYHIAHTVTDII